MWLNLWRKKVYVNIYPLLLVLSKRVCLNKSKFSPDLTLSNMVRKPNFLSILFFVSERVTFMSKKKVLSEFSQKFFKTTERHSLAVYGSFCGEKHFFSYLSPFIGLIKNSCLNKSKFSSGLPLSKMIGKQTF